MGTEILAETSTMHCTRKSTGIDVVCCDFAVPLSSKFRFQLIVSWQGAQQTLWTLLARHLEVLV